MLCTHSAALSAWRLPAAAAVEAACTHLLLLQGASGGALWGAASAARGAAAGLCRAADAGVRVLGVPGCCRQHLPAPLRPPAVRGVRGATAAVPHLPHCGAGAAALLRLSRGTALHQLRYLNLSPTTLQVATHLQLSPPHRQHIGQERAPARARAALTVPAQNCRAWLKAAAAVLPVCAAPAPTMEHEHGYGSVGGNLAPQLAILNLSERCPQRTAGARRHRGHLPHTATQHETLHTHRQFPTSAAPRRQRQSLQKEPRERTPRAFQAVRHAAC